MDEESTGSKICKRLVELVSTMVQPLRDIDLYSIFEDLSEGGSPTPITCNFLILMEYFGLKV